MCKKDIKKIEKNESKLEKTLKLTNEELIAKAISDMLKKDELS